MAFNPNVSNKKQVQDSPFLTLSQRNQKGISSQNIFGDPKAEDAKGTQGTSEDSIFARQARGGFDNPYFFGEKDERSGDDYLQENENGDVNFDEEGFYDDAWGISLSSNRSGASDPIKAGSSNKNDKAAQEKAKDELKTAIENGANDNEVSTLKDKAEAAGVEAYDIETIEKDTQVKAGASANTTGTQNQGANVKAASGNNTQAGLSSTNPYEMSPSQDVNQALSGVPDMAKAINSGTYQCHKTGNSSSSSSSSSDSGSTSTNWGAKIGNSLADAAISKVGGEIVSAAAKPITDPISEVGSRMGNWTKEKLGLGKGDEAKTVDEAKGNIAKGEKAGQTSTQQGTQAKQGVQETKPKVAEAKAQGAAAKGEVDTANNTAATSETEQDAQLDMEATYGAKAEEKEAVKEKCIDNECALEDDIQALDQEIASLDKEMSSCDDVTKATLQTKKATALAKKAQAQAQLAQEKVREAAATADQEEAEILQSEASEAAEAAGKTAEEAKTAAAKAEEAVVQAGTNEANYGREVMDYEKLQGEADSAVKEAKTFTAAANKRLDELQKSTQMQIAGAQASQITQSGGIAQVSSNDKGGVSVKAFGSDTPNQGHVAGGAGDALGGLGSNNVASSLNKRMIS